VWGSARLTLGEAVAAVNVGIDACGMTMYSPSTVGLRTAVLQRFTVTFDVGSTGGGSRRRRVRGLVYGCTTMAAPHTIVFSGLVVHRGRHGGVGA
jgi:hypothetical protein